MAFGSATTSISSAFADFFTSTTKQTYSDAGKFVLEFARRSYLLSRLTKGKASKSFQNGASIQDYVIFSEGGRGQRYDPQGELTPENRQGMVLHDAPWAFTSYDLTWTKHELALQAGGRDRDGQFAVFKRVRDAKLAMLKGRFSNSTEDDLWAQPRATVMETRTSSLPQEPTSIPAMINEFPNGLMTSAYTPDATTWTTKQGIAVATRTDWQAYKTTYADDVDALSTGSYYDLFKAFTASEIATRYDKMPFMDDEEDLQADKGPQLYVTSEAGLKNVSTGLALMNNYGRSGAQDPSYSSPVFNDKPIISCQALNTADIYPNAGGTALVDEADATVVGRSGGLAPVAPRFWLLNTSAMSMIWHTDNYFEPNPDGPVSPYRQPHVKTLWYDTWGNLFFRSLRHHALIYPGGALT